MIVFLLGLFFSRRKEPSPVEELLSRYGYLLERRCRRILRDDSLIDDAMQEILVSMWRSHEQYRGEPERILGWLYRITTNHCLRMLSRHKRWAETAQQWLEEHPQCLQSKPQAVSAEDLLTLEQLLETLEEEDRSIVLYRYIDGMTQDEIAKMLEITRDRVRHRLKKFQRHGLLLFESP